VAQSGGAALMGFGGTSKTKAKPSFTGIQLQTSSSVLPVALVYGMTRIAPNLWWYGDFASHKQKQGGKGFGGSVASFTYSASVILGLCEGPITGVARAWKDDGAVLDYASLGFSLFTGPIPQAPWGYLSAAHPDQADGYSGFAYLAKANYDLGSSAALPNHSFELQGLLYMTGVGGTIEDADPAQLVDDLLTHADHGAGFPPALIDYGWLHSSTEAGGAGDSAYQTYCRAMGFGLSPGMVEQESASDALDRWTLVTNTATVWNGAALKLVPYGDQTVTANGVTYLPPTGVCYALGDDDYQQSGDADPVRITRSDPADAKNSLKMVVRDRANAYNEVPVEWADDNAIALYGEKEAQAIAAREVCDPAMGGTMVAVVGQRLLYVRNQYLFDLDPRYDRLEPMDVVTIAEPGLGLTAQAVRVVEIEEQEDDTLSVSAEHFTGTTGHNTAADSPGAAPDPVNSLADPGPVNPPVFIEPPAALALALYGSAAPVVLIAVSGGDGTTAGPNWGGAVVWISADGGTTYQAVGEVQGAARMGVATSALALYGGANPDTLHTVGVNLSMSGGALAGATSAEAEAGVTLSWLGGEFLAYRDATLTGAHAYTLGGELWRGLQGTAAGAHLSGVAFVRVDDGLFRLLLPAAWLGVALKAKFQSFNLWGQALEDLAGCTAYDFTPAGTGYGGSSGGSGSPTEASEDIAVASGGFALVNIWDDAGVAKLRLADASDATRPAHAFVTAAIATAGTGVPYFSGQLSGLAAGTIGEALYLSATAGELTATPPAGSGELVQYVALRTGADTADFQPVPLTQADINP
jgi:hypothetical protein